MQDRGRDRDWRYDRQSGDQWTVRGYMVYRTSRTFSPPTDVIELPDRLVILVEIAGMQPDSFTITLATNQLTITGTRERPALSNAAYHQVEIGYGDFRVDVYLPWMVERDEVTATYRDGFLQVDLPRRAPLEVRVVAVESGDAKRQDEQHGV